MVRSCSRGPPVAPPPQPKTSEQPDRFPSPHRNTSRHGPEPLDGHRHLGHDDPMRSPRPLAALLAALGLGAVLALAAPTPPTAQAASVAPVSAPGKTAQIHKVSSTTADGWRFDYYENPAYPCSVSGENTFTIATRLGVPDDEVRPLWVFMHGGGVGYFDPSGKAMPNDKQKVE